MIEVLSGASGPLSMRLIRERCRMRTATVVDVLDLLIADHRTIRQADGYSLIEDV